MAQLNLKPNQKGVTVLIVVASVIFVCCLLACLGAVSKVKAVNNEKAEVEKQVRESQTIAQTQRDSENKYIDTRAQIRCLESSVSTQAYVPTLLKQIERLGKSVDLKVIGVRPKAPDPNAELSKKAAANGAGGADGAASGTTPAATPKPEAAKPYDELAIDMELEGDYMNALDFLYRITSFPKIMAVNTVQMTPETGMGLSKSPRLNIRINVTAFVFKENSRSSKQAASGTPVGDQRQSQAPVNHGIKPLALTMSTLSVSPRGDENALHFQRRTGNEAG